jgi:hypothetical protein
VQEQAFQVGYRSTEDRVSGRVIVRFDRPCDDLQLSDGAKDVLPTHATELLNQASACLSYLFDLVVDVVKRLRFAYRSALHARQGKPVVMVGEPGFDVSGTN